MYVCYIFTAIDFVSFNDFSIQFWICSNSMVFLGGFDFITILSTFQRRLRFAEFNRSPYTIFIFRGKHLEYMYEYSFSGLCIL